jgi:hypothetical protein
MSKMVLAWREESQGSNSNFGKGGLLVEERIRKVLMLLVTFTVSVTYVAGLSTPGGFWDNTQGDHLAGEVILKDHHSARLAVFFVSNTTAFIVSLLITVLLLDRKLRNGTVRSREVYGCIILVLVGLVAAFVAGSCSEIGPAAYVICLVVAGLVGMVLQGTLADAQRTRDNSGRYAVHYLSQFNKAYVHQVTHLVFVAISGIGEETISPLREETNNRGNTPPAILLLLSTFATTITYQAGLVPPGGIWQEDGDGHLAGDPILLTTNPGRYKAFLYCNSLALVTSVVIIIWSTEKLLLRGRVAETVVILELFGLTGAYAAGACRDISTSIYVMAMGVRPCPTWWFIPSCCRQITWMSAGRRRVHFWCTRSASCYTSWQPWSQA